MDVSYRTTLELDKIIARAVQLCTCAETKEMMRAIEPFATTEEERYALTQTNAINALLLKNGISAICMHTNLDAAPGGVNDTLCDILGIAAEGRESFAEGCGRIGTTMPTTVEALAKFCAATLHSGVKYVNGQKPVTCLAEVSGGGGSYLEEAIARGADCLVTGEAAHHIALLARQKGIGLVVAGHWGTEHAIADVLAVQLEKQFPALTVAHAEADADPYSYLL